MVALVLVPTARAFSRLLWVLAFCLLIVGAMLFYTERVRKREEALRGKATGHAYHGRALPSDIHNYTGWQHGGRSDTMDAGSSTTQWQPVSHITCSWSGRRGRVRLYARHAAAAPLKIGVSGHSDSDARKRRDGRRLELPRRSGVA